MDESVSQVEKFIKPESVERALRQIIPGAHISRGEYYIEAPGYINDAEWNHMDQFHRNFVHNTYNDAMRVVSGKDFALSVTRWKRLPIFIQVYDVKLSPTLYYQVFNVCGLIQCHLVIRFVQKAETVLIQASWSTASHWLLRPLHAPFNRRFLKLQAKQAAEDVPIRARRFELRKQGFRSVTDRPDFINSNMLTDNLIPPEIPPVRATLSHLQDGAMEEIRLGPLVFHVKKDGDGYLVWPAVCSHEGAVMPKENICNGVVRCPWHGRQFEAVRLSPRGETSLKFANLTIRLEHDSLALG